MSRDKAYLTDILTAAEHIFRYLDGVTRDEFLANTEKQDAVIRRFEIIGEAARHLSPEARLAMNAIPWRLITGMRNILIHDYDDVDVERVFDTAENELNRMVAEIRLHLNSDGVNS